MPALTGSSKTSAKETLNRKGFGSQEHAPIRVPRVIVRKRLTALVVDSELSCQMQHEGLLLLFGLVTMAVSTGRDALNLLASGQRFDLIVIAMFLGDMNGLEVVRQIRGMALRCKIVGYAANGDGNERQAFLEAGADDFFEKPLLPEYMFRVFAGLV